MGYVYAGDYCTPDEAERTLRRLPGPAARDLEAPHPDADRRNRTSWVRNCVAIGLSSGFVEPLSRPDLLLIQHGIEQLVKHFPTRRGDPVMTAHYKRLVARCMDGVREF